MNEMFLENIQTQNEIDKLMTMYEMVNLKLEQNRRDIETKVTTEGGDYDDLVTLYSEAEEVADKQKKGFFAKLFDIIAGIFKKIKSFLFGNKSTGNDEDMIEVSESAIKDVEAIENAAKQANDSKKFFGRDWLNVKNILTAITLTTAAVGGTVVYKKIKRKEANKHIEKLQNSSNIFEDIFNNLRKTVDSWFGHKGKNKDEEKAASDSVGIFSKLMSKFNEKIRSLFNIFGGKKENNDDIKALPDSKNGIKSDKGGINGHGKEKLRSAKEEKKIAENKKSAENGIQNRQGKDGKFYKIDTFNGKVFVSDKRNGEYDEIRGNQILSTLPNDIKKDFQKYLGKLKLAENDREKAFNNKIQTTNNDLRVSKDNKNTVVITDKKKNIKYTYNKKNKTWDWKGKTDSNQKPSSDVINTYIRYGKSKRDIMESLTKDFIYDLISHGYMVESEDGVITIGSVISESVDFEYNMFGDIYDESDNTVDILFDIENEFGMI